MTLDIVIPTLNEYENLLKLIPYLKSHTDNEKTKVIVVDAANSNDKTEEICLEYDIQYIKGEISQRANQLNLGAINGKAASILFLHADVTPPKDFQSCIQKALQSNYSFGLFAYKFDSSNWGLKFNSYFTRWNNFFTGGGDQCHFMKRETYNAFNGYDEDLAIMEDFNLYDRIRSQGIPCKVVQSKATVSARKYKQHSYFKINWTNLKILVMYKLGYPQSKLLEIITRFKNI